MSTDTRLRPGFACLLFGVALLGLSAVRLATGHGRGYEGLVSELRGYPGRNPLH